MKGCRRRKWWVPLLAAKALKGAPGTLGVATGQPGETAFEFISTVNQNVSNFSAIGYLTAVSGLPEAELFTDPVIRSQNTARFTVSVSAKLVSRNVLGVMFVLDEAGTFAVSYNETAGVAPATCLHRLGSLLTKRAPSAETLRLAERKDPGEATRASRRASCQA